MNRFAPLALTATVVGLALLIGIGLLLQPDIGPSPGPSASATPLPAVRSNGWIAFSTLPANYQTGISVLQGGDIYLVRDGEEQRLIAARGDGNTRNVCPVFSPDGRLLAFGEGTATSRAIVVLGVDDGGVTNRAPLRLTVPGTGDAPCPRWSADGTRVAYLDDAGAIIVRGLDGSSPPRARGDPVGTDFVHDSERSLVSPDGEFVLYMEDSSPVSFRMYMVANGGPSHRIYLAGAGVNDTRSWPGRTDVSWQPIYASEPPTGAVLPARDLAVGQCFNTPSMGRVGNLTDTELQEVTVIDCSEPHLSEVVGVVQNPAPPDADFSASDDYSGDYIRACETAWEAYRGDPRSRDLWPTLHMTGPTRATWEAGDRSVVCFVLPQRGQLLHGSLKADEP